MNNCKRFEKLLPGYLHGELYEKEYHALRAHLEHCADCQAELDAQHAALQLAGRVLRAVPTAARISRRRHQPVRKVDLRQNAFAKIWFSPQFKAALATCVIAVCFFFISISFVSVQVVTKSDVAFEAAEVKRPRMALKKLQVPVAQDHGGQPKLRRSIVVKPHRVGMDIEMPEIVGIRGGMDFAPESDDSSSMAQQAERPAMTLKKPKVEVAKGAQPKPSSRIVAKVKTAPMPAIKIPDIEGAGEGLLGGAGLNDGFVKMPSGDDISAVRDTIASLESHDLFGRTATAETEDYSQGMGGLGFSMDLDLFGSSAPAAEEAAGNSNFRYDSLQVTDAEAYDGVEMAGTILNREYQNDYATVNGGLGNPFSGGEQPQPDTSVLSLNQSDSGQASRYNYQVADAEPVSASSGMDYLVEKSRSVSTTSGDKVDMGMVARKDLAKKAWGYGDDLFGGEGISSGNVVGYAINGSALADPSAPDRNESAQVEIEAKFTEFDSDALNLDWKTYEVVPVDEGPAQKAALPDERQEMAIHGDVDLMESKKWAGQMVDAVPPRRERKPAGFNPYVMAEANPFSTFSIDVDTASYGLARQQLLSGSLPDTEAVRTEEFVNSFDYDYRPPAGTQTFAVHTEMAPSPFRSRMELLKIGVKGRRIGRDDHRGANLTLVIDTSGSMSTPDRLDLVQQSLSMLIDQLNPEDRVAIVQFGGEARLVCEHTAASDKAALRQAINTLQAGGPTQFDKGLELGYQLATTGYEAGDSNRIIILSDGVANLGELDPDAILEQVANYRKKGIYLSVLGFGAGSYDDEMLEQLANRGDGTYAYVNSLDDARHLFVDQLAATLHVIASDVKIQVEFNPGRVLRYRQVGYENRQLTKEQFRDDTVDAGEVGSGQSVTALYEVELKPDAPEREPISTVYVRYRRADNGVVEEISSRVADADRKPRFDETNPRFQLATCVAEFAEHLRRSPYTEGTEVSEIQTQLQPVTLKLDLDRQVQELPQLISITTGLEN